MRSDWDSAPVSEGGDEDAVTGANTAANGTADGRDPETGRRWTIFEDNNNEDESIAGNGNGNSKGGAKTPESADEHVQKYVQDQLKRLMTADGPTQYEDEIEAKYDSM